MIKRLLSFLRGGKGERTWPESRFNVSISDQGVSVVRPDGKVETVDWADLRSVHIENTDSGPFAPDVFWVLAGTESGCVIPQGATGEGPLLERLQELPGFDNEQVITAAMSMENAQFICWKHDDD